MKNILKTTIFAFLLISLSSCTNDKDPIAIQNGFELRDVSETSPPAVLLQINEAKPFIALQWDRANYSVPTGNTGISGLTYKIVVTDKATGAISKSVVNTTERDSILTVKQFNTLLSSLTSFNCGEMNVEIKIESTLGNVIGNQSIQYSNPITLAVTGYSNEKRMLSFAKDSQSSANAPKILSSSPETGNDYEGYVYLEPGNYKFYQPNSCGDFSSPIIYGGSSGVLVEGLDAASINLTVAGHYLVKANLTTGSLTYSVQFFKALGIFGTAIRTVGFANAVPSEDAAKTNVWTITIELFKGRKFRFKSNDWTVPLTGTPPSVPAAAVGTTTPSILGAGTTDGTLVEVIGTAGDITVPGTNDGTKQKYNITIDVSKPRNYTYTLNLNPN